jgi:MIP family channel proteins
VRFLAVTTANPVSATPTLSRKLAAEAVGTFVFVLVGAGSALGSGALLNGNSASLLLVAAFANGLGLAVAVSATLSVSGGALNPAVVLGLWAAKKLQNREVIPYILAELVGAIAAGLALVAAFPASLGNPVHWGSPTMSALLNSWQGIGIEALLTFVLMFAIYGTAIDPRHPKIGGLGIGIAVVADVLVAGNLTGAAMNPARAFGPMIAGQFFPGYWYVYLIGPVIGAIVAAIVYRYAIETPNE